MPILYRVQEYFILGFAISISYIGSTTIFNKKIIYNNRGIGIFFICFIYLITSWERVNSLYATELNRMRYGNYKNYFIELILGRAKKNFQEKSSEYEKLIINMLEKQNKNKN